MKEASGSFVHVFLFECGGCGSPVSSATASAARNIEQMDARSFSLQCNICGWSAKSLGTGAKRHWVDTWDTSSNTDKENEELRQDVTTGPDKQTSATMKQQRPHNSGMNT